MDRIGNLGVALETERYGGHGFNEMTMDDTAGKEKSLDTIENLGVALETERAGEDFYEGWIELNSVTQTVTEAVTEKPFDSLLGWNETQPVDDGTTVAMEKVTITYEHIDLV